MGIANDFRARDYVLSASLCFMVLVMVHQGTVRGSLSSLETELGETREVRAWQVGNVRMSA
jgi:hypothetical protein